MTAAGPSGPPGSSPPQASGNVLVRLFGSVRALPRSGALVFGFSLFMTFVYMPYDVFAKPLFQDVALAREVWGGVMLTGWSAKLTEPLHWLIYAALAHGFHRRRDWVWPFSAVYTVYVGVASGVWSILYGHYGAFGYGVAALVSLLFFAIALDLWRSRPRALV